MRNHKGFTLIELLIVIVILGILIAIAIPKFSNSKDKAKLASIRTDLRNLESAQEAYFTDFTTYGSLSDLQSASNFTLSSGNTMTVVPGTSGYAATATNSSISSAVKQCTVQVAGGAGTTLDAVIVCS